MAENSLNLTLGKGKYYFAEFLTGTQTAGGERFLGNCSEVTINSEVSELDHRSSTEGRMKKDFSVVTGVERAGSIVTDDMDKKNLAIFALGAATTTSVSSATAVSETIVDVQQGLTYQVGTTTARPEGARKLASLTVMVGAGLKTLATDYTVDLDLGRITIVTGGGIAADADIIVAYNQTAHSVVRIEAGFTRKEGALRWISNNPDGPQTDYFFPWVKLGPNGDLSLVAAEDWNTIPIGIEVFEKDSLPPWVATGRPVTA